MLESEPESPVEKNLPHPKIGSKPSDLGSYVSANKCRAALCSGRALTPRAASCRRVQASPEHSRRISQISSGFRFTRRDAPRRFDQLCGETKPQKHETRLEGGPVPGKRGNIETFSKSDTPRKSESLQALFLATGEPCPQSTRLRRADLQPERRTHVFCYLTLPLTTPPREAFRRRPAAPDGPQRQGARDGLCPRPDAPH